MRGRPAASKKRNLSDMLLSAAEKCWHEKKSHLDVTSREIAELAGTHSGMVNYYFGSRDGIFSALLEAQIARSAKCLKQIEAAIEAGNGDPTEILVRGLFDAYYPSDTPSERQSILLVEILRQGSPIREVYLRRGGSQPFACAKALVKNLIARGAFKQDLDPVPTTQIILSLVMAPLALAPVWQLTDSDANPMSANRESWIAKVVQLVRQDAAAEA
ncbi:MAG: TetR/AcrR family transcriptional regulator [Georgfuchsia sp.]